MLFISTILRKIHFKIFGYSIGRNFLILSINMIIPTILKNFLNEYYWKNLNFKKTEINLITIYDKNKGKKIKKVDINHKEKAKRIYNKIISDNSNIKNILEFGCSYGENLDKFLINKECEVVGIDINKVVKIKEHKFENFSGIIGDYRSLKNFKDSFFDVSFCCSVLDHIGDEKKVFEIIKELSRISKSFYLFEPFIKGVYGDVSYFYRYQIEEKFNLKNKIERNGKQFAKSSYLWNYDYFLEELGLNFKKESFKLHVASLGPFYYSYYIKSD